MGRGLSDLQKWMAFQALQNREREGRKGDTDGACGADLYFAEVKAGYFGAEIVHYGRSCPDADLRKSHASHNFKAPSPAAAASISRAAKRLRDRGLAHWMSGYCRWSGITLTEAGVEAARKVSVISCQISAKS